MTIASRDVLSDHLKPLRPRGNHVMKYESGNSRAEKYAATGNITSA